MAEEDAREPYLDQLIEEAVAPLSGLFSADHLATLRQVLRDSVEDDPDLAQLYQAARPRQVQARTHEQAIGAETEDPAAQGPVQEPPKAAPFRRSGGAA
jgi:hypothetical protein